MSYANGTSVGRKQVFNKGFRTQSVAPVLARRAAAAGTRQRKVVQTGVVGKALNPEQAARLANVKGKKAVGPEGVRYRRAIYSRHAVTDKAERHELGGLDSNGLARATRRRGVSYSDLERHMRSKEPRGDAGGVFKGVLKDVAAAMTGTTKPMAAAPAAPASGGLKAVRSPSSSAPKPLAGSATPTPMAKRRYDPEDERRHRQGFYAGAGATGGAMATGYGVRGIARDTRRVLRTPDVPHPGEKVHGLRQVLNGHGYEDLDEAGKAKLDALNAGANLRHENQRLAHQAVRNLKSHRGVLVRPRAAALTLGGLAAMGGSAKLQSRRRESRYE